MAHLWMANVGGVEPWESVWRFFKRLSWLAGLPSQKYGPNPDVSNLFILTEHCRARESRMTPSLDEDTDDPHQLSIIVLLLCLLSTADPVQHSPSELIHL